VWQRRTERIFERLRRLLWFWQSIIGVPQDRPPNTEASVAIVWLQNTNYTWSLHRENVPCLPIASTNVTFAGMINGLYKTQWLKTGSPFVGSTPRPGKWLTQPARSGVDMVSSLTVVTPEFTHDAAAIIFLHGSVQEHWISDPTRRLGGTGRGV
jgi:hypothetical protein